MTGKLTRADTRNLSTKLKFPGHTRPHPHHSGRFQNPPWATHKHPLINLHTAIVSLPVETSYLTAVSPEF